MIAEKLSGPETLRAPSTSFNVIQKGGRVDLHSLESLEFRRGGTQGVLYPVVQLWMIHFG